MDERKAMWHIDFKITGEYRAFVEGPALTSDTTAEAADKIYEDVKNKALNEYFNADFGELRDIKSDLYKISIDYEI